MANKLLPVIAIAGAALVMRKKSQPGPNCCGKCVPILDAPNYRCTKPGETDSCANCVHKVMMGTTPVCDAYNDQPVNAACTCDAWAPTT